MTRNIFGIHTSNSDYPEDTIRDLIDVSAVVKVCVLFSDSNRLHEMRSWARSGTVFLGRHIVLDIAGGELHNRINAVDDNDWQGGYDVGVWYANALADQVIPNGLSWVIWEGCPNEWVSTGSKAAGEAMGVIEQALRRGIKVAVGGYSYGMPQIPPIDTVDAWTHWGPVFAAIDSANRDASGKALADPRVYFYLHEGAKIYKPGYNYPDMKTSIPYTVRRYGAVYDRYVTPKGRWVPIILSEFAYGADYDNPTKPPTEEIMRQLVEINAILANDTYLVGYCWYDTRKTSDNTFDDYRYCTRDMVRTMRAQNYTHEGVTPPTGIVEVPPVTPPVPVPAPAPAGMVAVYTTSTSGQNIRAHHSLIAPIVGSLEFGEVAYVSAAEIAAIGQAKTWIYIKAPHAEGWAAAWLLKVA